MDKVKTYISYIETILQKYATLQPVGDWNEYENQVIIDKNNKHFQLIRVGWKGSERTYHIVMHLDIKDDKIWIQEDWTEEGIANELTQMGVPKDCIVLGFYAPFRRGDTEFATA